MLKDLNIVNGVYAKNESLEIMSKFFPTDLSTRSTEFISTPQTILKLGLQPASETS